MVKMPTNDINAYPKAQIAAIHIFQKKKYEICLYLFARSYPFPSLAVHYAKKRYVFF